MPAHTHACTCSHPYTVPQIPKGAWFSLLVAFVMAVISYTWHWGQELKLGYIRKHAVPLRQLFAQVRDAAGGPVAAGRRAKKLAQSAPSTFLEGLWASHPLDAARCQPPS